MTQARRALALPNVDRALVLAVWLLYERKSARRAWKQLARDPKFAYQEMASLLFIGSLTLAALFPWPWFWLMQRQSGDSLLIPSAKYAVVCWPAILGLTGWAECILRSAREEDTLAGEKAAPLRLDVFENARVLAVSTMVGTVATLGIALLLGSLHPW